MFFFSSTYFISEYLPSSFLHNNLIILISFYQRRQKKNELQRGMCVRMREQACATVREPELPGEKPLFDSLTVQLYT